MSGEDTREGIESPDDTGDGDEFEDDDFGDFEEAAAAPVPSTSSARGSVEETPASGPNQWVEEPFPPIPSPTPMDSLFDTAVSACGSLDGVPTEPEEGPDKHQPTAIANLVAAFDSREQGPESGMAESLEIWREIRCVEETPALRFHWLKSNAFAGLLFALGITPPASSSANPRGSADNR